jgi:hypothetical protein
MFQHVAGGPEIGALDDIEYLDDIGVVELFEDVVLSLDFGGFDGHQHFDDYFLLGFYVSALEDVGVLAPADLVGDGIVLEFAE